MSIGNAIVQLWTSSRRTHQTPSGWIAGNAACCNDTRGRGGMIINADGSIAYSCFNCNFNVVYKPGDLIKPRVRRLLEYLGATDETINQLCLAALRSHESTNTTQLITKIPTFHIRELPPGSQPLKTLINNPTPNIIPVLEYIHKRGFYLEDYDFYYSPVSQYKNRLIIPFYHDNRIVGYTSRRIDNNPLYRYISDQQPGYLFNLDHQRITRKFVILTEGVMDAIAVDGVALLGSVITNTHNIQLQQLNREIILVPDRDAKGMSLIDQALKYNYSVSLPEWPDDIKDAADAMNQLGRLSTLWMIRQATLTNPTKIQVKAKFWFTGV